MEPKETFPFTKEFVLRAAANRLRKAMRYCLRKTRNRLNDFEPGSEKHREVKDTLSVLELADTRLQSQVIKYLEEESK